MKISKIVFLILIISSSISFAQEKEIDVPVTILEDIPKFPNCINDSNDNIQDSKMCFIQEMSNHIKLNFRYPSVAKKKKIQGRVVVKFIINKEGNVINVETNAPEGCELLEEEAARIINLLPKFKPGEQRGEPVNVSYAQPIMFKL
ncbi:energy transducer TonB [uncultured Flavobacterium sp.]|uniref:energy transducer TonB n=1 Tax=uncultured Flavobacterium sp. TaxID=165435 RepID=UPI0030C81587